MISPESTEGRMVIGSDMSGSGVRTVIGSG